MERTGSPDDVAYALSTWKRAREFQAGVEDLAQKIPLVHARAYLSQGNRLPEYSDETYEEIDRLQALRRNAIQAEMRYVKAQVFCLFRDGKKGANFVAENSPLGLTPEEAARALESALGLDEADGSVESGACARLLLGDAVLSGDDLRFGFSREIYYAAPSLGVYELFMWTALEELERASAVATPV